MRELQAATIVDEVARLCMEANYFLGEDVLEALRKGMAGEEAPVGREVFGQLLENADIARREQVPMCQDTGMATFFLELGQDVHITGGNLEEAINEGVRRGYLEGRLRKSVVGDPLERKNTGDNTPAVIHIRMAPGDKLKIVLAPKGAGSENMSALKMLKPSEGVEGVKDFVLATVKTAGPNPCPPIIVGVGIGGNFEECALLAKKALIRRAGAPNPLPEIATLEAELLRRINDLGIGPQGLGGRITALAVHVEVYATHIASLPVAVNLSCHAYRHKEVVL